MIPMSQFEVINDYLTIINTSRWDYFYGFRRIIKNLKG